MAENMEDRVRQLEDQLRQALAKQLPIGVALPNKFDDGDIVSWLDSFDVCATANNWNNDARLRRLPTLLVGRAFAIFQRLPNNQKDTMAQLREALIEAFLPAEKRGARYSEFDAASLKQGESWKYLLIALRAAFAKLCQISMAMRERLWSSNDSFGG